VFVLCISRPAPSGRSKSRAFCLRESILQFFLRIWWRSIQK
jgi:hypothetical protein